MDLNIRWFMVGPAYTSLDPRALNSHNTATKSIANSIREFQMNVHYPFDCVGIDLTVLRGT